MKYIILVLLIGLSSCSTITINEDCVYIQRTFGQMEKICK